MPSKSRHGTALWLGSLLTLPLSLGCENICDYNKVDCRPKLAWDPAPQLALDSKKSFPISFTRYLISSPAQVLITQPPSSSWTYNLPIYSPDCQTTNLSNASYSCTIPLSPMDMPTAGFKIGTASVRVTDALDGDPLDKMDIQPLSMVYSQFIFHLDNTSGSGMLPVPPNLMPGQDDGLQEVEIFNSKLIKVARSYTNSLDNRVHREFYDSSYTPPMKASSSGRITWGMPVEDQEAESSFITANSVWATKYQSGMPTLATLFNNMSLKASAQLPASLHARLLLISPTADKAFMVMTDSSVQTFLTMGGSQMPTLVAPPPTSVTVQTLRVGHLLTNPELLVATTDFLVSRYDLTMLQPVLPRIALPLPDNAPGQLDAVGIGDLDMNGPDELVVASGDTLYIWQALDLAQPQLVSTGTKLPKGAKGLSIAIGDVDGDARNDIVVATKDNLYVFLHDPPPQ